MDFRCYKCGAPLGRKKCEYCGARNKKSGKKARRLEDGAHAGVDTPVVVQPVGTAAGVSRDSEQRKEVESADRAPDESQRNGGSGWSEGCASGCASPDGCADGCLSVCGDGCGCSGGCAEGCLKFIGEMIGEAIGSLFDGL